MKAYELTHDTTEGSYSLITWAETDGKAKSYGVHHEELGEPEFTAIHCRRIPWADELQGISKDDLLVERIRHGASFYYGEYDFELLDETILPLVDKYGSLSAVLKRYDQGLVKYVHDEWLEAKSE